MSITRSRPTGGRCASTSRESRSRAWASTWPAMWAPTTVRRMVLGDAMCSPRRATASQMKGLVRDAMRDGAVGVSTALQYAPAPYAKTPELIALAGEAASTAASMPRTCAARAMRARVDRRGGDDWPRGAHPGRDLAPESRGQGQLGPHAADRGAHRKGRAQKASTSAPTRMPTRPGSIHSLPSFRRGRTTAAMPS
jgi:hypothetical protein